MDRMEKSGKGRLSLRSGILMNTVKNNVASCSKKPLSVGAPDMTLLKKYISAITELSKCGEWDMKEIITVKPWKRFVTLIAIRHQEQWKFRDDKYLTDFANNLMSMFFDESNPYLHRAKEKLDNNQIALLFKAKEIYEEEQDKKLAAMAQSFYYNGSAQEDNDIYNFAVEANSPPLEPYRGYPVSPKCVRDRSVSPKRIFQDLPPSKDQDTNFLRTSYPSSTLSRNRNKRTSTSSYQSAENDQRKKHRSGDIKCSPRHRLNIKVIKRISHNSPQGSSTERSGSVEKKTLTDQEILTELESNRAEHDDIFENSYVNASDEDVVYENPTPPCSPACIPPAADGESLSHENRDNSKLKILSSPLATSPELKKVSKSSSSASHNIKPPELTISEKRKKGISIKKQTPSKEPLTQSVENQPIDDIFELPDIDTEPSHVEQPSPHIEQDKENYPVSADEIVVKYPKPLTAPALTLEMFEALKDALDRPPKEKVVTGFSLYILQEDLAVYSKDTEWLNDRNIDFYLELIRERSMRAGYPRVYIFHSFFYTLLTDKDGGYEFVRETTGEDDLLKYDIVFFPVHLNHHWRLVVVKFSEKSLKCYDSMNHDNSDVLRHIGRYLKREYRRKHRNNNIHGTNSSNGVSSSEDERASPIPIASAGEPVIAEWFFASSLWTVENVSSESIPQQKNAIDCGVFLLQYAEYLSREKEFDFDQSHIPYFRKRIMYETLTKQLLTSARNENVVKPEES